MRRLRLPVLGAAIAAASKRRAPVAAGAAVMLPGPAAGVASAGTVAVATSERERQS